MLLSRHQRKVAPRRESSGLLGREAYIPKVYELAELNTKRACVRLTAKKTTACVHLREKALLDDVRREELMAPTAE